MAVTIPTRRQLYDDILAELESELNVTIPIIGKNVLRAFATVQASKLHLYWRATALVLKNVFPDTADPESIGGTLDRFGRAFLGRNRFAAVQGVYTVQVTGLIASVIPANTTFKSDDTAASAGFLFVLDVEKTLLAPTDTMTLRALTAGPDAQLIVGNTLTSTSPLTNVDDQVEVTVVDTEPTPEEPIEIFRAAILRAIRLESQGGAATDYRLWANDAQGIRFVFPYVTSGQCSQVDLYIEALQVGSADGMGTPTAGQIAAVTAVVNLDPDTTLPINQRGRKPLTVTVNYLPVAVKPVTVAINGSIGIDVATQDAITSALIQEVDSVRPFVDAADVESNRNDRITSNNFISIIQNILTGGQSFSTITINVDGSPETNIQFTAGDIPFLDPANVTFP